MKNIHVLLASVGFFLYPSLALAEEGAEGGGLPQMDVTFYAGEIFWLAICFTLFYLLIQRLAVPAVEETQNKRQQILSTDMDAAKSAQGEIEQKVASYEKELAVARSAAQATVVEITTKASAEADKQKTEQRLKLEKRLTETEEKISVARTKALEEVRGVAADVAQSVLSKVGVSLSVKEAAYD